VQFHTLGAHNLHVNGLYLTLVLPTSLLGTCGDFPQVHSNQAAERYIPKMGFHANRYADTGYGSTAYSVETVYGEMRFI
jgi:hypothetical protein